MSYELSMQFKEVKGDILKEIAKIKFELKQKINTIIEENISYIPSMRFENRGLPDNVLEAKDSAWLQKVMTFKVVCWPQYNLIGIVAPYDIEGAKKVFFQNSCDQDYDYSEWPEIEFFQKIIKEVDSMKAEQLMEIFSDWDDTPLDYIKRSYVYNKVCEELGVIRWLYNQKEISEEYSHMKISLFDEDIELIYAEKACKVMKAKKGKTDIF